MMLSQAGFWRCRGDHGGGKMVDGYANAGTAD